jgi:GT2 family glycosyltransferase
MKSKISIITVTYNSDPFLKGYFDSIAESVDGSSEFEVEILIYDAGSTDDTLETIGHSMRSREYIKLIEGKNVGFASANNILAKACSGDYLFILNPDTKLDKECLKNIWNDAQRDSAILAPMQLFFDGSYLSNGVGMDIFGYPCDKGCKKMFYADGAAIFMKKSLFFGLGMFDEDYFMFQEDIDLSWRARLMGVPVAKVPDAIVYHFSGGSIKGGAIKNGVYATNILRRYLGERNCLQNLLKNYSVPSLFFILPVNFLMNLTESILFIILLQPGVSAQYFKAYWWNFTHIVKILDKRREAQKKRSVPDRKIISQMYFGSSKLKLLFMIGVPKYE